MKTRKKYSAERLQIGSGNQIKIGCEVISYFVPSDPDSHPREKGLYSFMQFNQYAVYFCRQRITNNMSDFLRTQVLPDESAIPICGGEFLIAESNQLLAWTSHQKMSVQTAATTTGLDRLRYLEDERWEDIVNLYWEYERSYSPSQSGLFSKNNKVYPVDAPKKEPVLLGCLPWFK